MNAEAKTCPVCRLINPPEAGLCDCGYNFELKCGGAKKKVFSFKGQKHLVWILLAVVASGIWYLVKCHSASGPSGSIFNPGLDTIIFFAILTILLIFLISITIAINLDQGIQRDNKSQKNGSNRS